MSGVAAGHNGITHHSRTGARKAVVTSRRDFGLCATTVAVIAGEAGVQLCIVSAFDGTLVANRFADGGTAAALRGIADYLDGLVMDQAGLDQAGARS